MQYTPRRLRLEKQRKRKKYKGQVARLCLVVLIIIGFWFVARQLQTLIVMSRARSITVKEGILESVFPTEAVIARYELVYTCPLSGELKVVAKEKERIPEGALIAVVTGEGSSTIAERPIEKIYAKKAGIVSYKLDGLENILTPETIGRLKTERIFEQARTASSQIVANQKIVPSGTGFVKVVNNLKPVIMSFILPKEAFSKAPQIGDLLSYRLEDQAKLMNGKIIEITANQEGYNIIAETSDWSQEFLSKRLVDLEFVTETFAGIIIPQSSLSEREGVTGVYVVTSNRYKFEPVELIGQVGDLVAVAGLEEGEEILVESIGIK